MLTFGAQPRSRGHGREGQNGSQKHPKRTPNREGDLKMSSACLKTKVAVTCCCSHPTQMQRHTPRCPAQHYLPDSKKKEHSLSICRERVLGKLWFLNI